MDELLQHVRLKHPNWEVRIYKGKLQRKIGKRFQTFCEHERRKSQCKECGGSEICEHGRINRLCKECGGSAICEHERRKSQCKECGGSAICEHGRYKPQCKECGGSAICEHGRRKSECKECGGSAICEHGRRKSECKECGGSAICQHNRNKRFCKQCRGSAICEHGRYKTICKDCGGSALCKHGRYKPQCKECGGSALCEHGRHKYECKECGGSAFCEHGRYKSQCKECGGSRICKHGRFKTHCKECGGSAFCKHGRQKQRCKECGGSSICEHGRQKQQCKECGTKTYCEICKIHVLQFDSHNRIKHSKCQNIHPLHGPCSASKTSRTFSYKYCYECGCFLFGRTPVDKRQDSVFQFIEECFGDEDYDYTIRYDKQLPDQNCTKKRPDVLFMTQFRHIIVECDENQHRHVDTSCLNAYLLDNFLEVISPERKRAIVEESRMNELVASGDILPTVFIRFNPDTYRCLVPYFYKFRDEEGVKRKINLDDRLKTLEKQIRYWLNCEHEQKDFITVVFLFYDGPSKRMSSVPI